MEKKWYDLTKTQENIWLTYKYYQTNSISNVSGTLLFKNPIDLDKLEKAINIFIQKNEALNLCIDEKKGIPYQYTKDYKYTKFERIFFNSKKELKEKEKEFAQINLNELNKNMYKIILIKLKNGKGGFNITGNHLLVDAWSMSLVANEISSIYYDVKNGKESNQENFPSYIDYIKTEEKYLKSEKYKKDSDYFEKMFKEAPTEVSFSNKIAPAKTPKAERYICKLENSKEIAKYCKEQGFPVFTFFMTVFSLYLNKISNVKDIVLGTPILNRNGSKEKNTIGMFVNTLPMKVHIEKGTVFTELVKQVYKEQFSLFRHYRYPYTNILKYVREKYNFSNNLYDTIVSYQNARDDSKTAKEKYKTDWVFCGEISNTMDIHIYDMDDSGTLELYYDYQVEKINKKEIKNINNRILYIIKQILNKKDINIDEIQLLDKEENKQIKNFNNTKTKYNKNETLISLFEKQVKKTPQKQALQFKNEILTYSELYNKVLTYANYLKKQGVTKNTPVVLLLNRSLETVIAVLATLKAGGYYIAIDPFWPQNRIEFIIQNSDSKYLITSEKYVAKYEDKINCIIVEKLNTLSNNENFKNVTTPEDLAYILYTSGSTGEPKGTLITNKNVVGLLNATHHIFKQTKEDVWTLFHTYTFDFSTWEIYGSLLYGGKLVVVPKEITTNPKKFFDLVVKEKVTILNQTPAYFYKVIEQEKLLNKQELAIRYVILGGEAVQAKPLKYFKEKYPNIIIYNGYGPTETTVFAIMGEITEKDILEDKIYIGKPIPNYQIHILDSNLNQLPIGVDGEICISGVGACNGYFKKSELTKEKFVQTKQYGRLYKSGDVGHFCEDGKIYYVGRNDNQVKIRGFRIELEEIQKQILNCEHVKKATVVPVENNNFTKSLVAFFEADKENIEEDVLEEIKKHLTSYMIPKLYQVSEFPINNNGKVDVKYLIKNIHEKNDKREVIEPKNNLEREILEVLQALTSNQNISTTDDFFDELGLDSLSVMDLATKLSKYNIEIQDINNYTTIEKLANKINNNKYDEFLRK